MPEIREDRKAWDAVASFWNERMGDGNDFVELLIWPAVQKLLPQLRDARVLDIGCGNGLYARKLAALGARVLAIDYSAEMIAHARGRRIRLGSSTRFWMRLIQRVSAACPVDRSMRPYPPWC